MKITKKQELEKRLTDSLGSLLPEGFVLESIDNWVALNDNSRVDILANVKAPIKTVRLAIEIEDAERLSSLRHAAHYLKNVTTISDDIPMIAGWFIGERARRVLKEEGVGYIDLAGNLYLKHKNFYVEKIVDKNPFTSKPPLKNIFAPISSRITRAMLIEPDRVWLMNELSLATGVSIGQAYKVLHAMDEDAELVIRHPVSGGWILKDPRALIAAWKKVYPTYQNHLYRMFSYERDAKLPDLIMEAAKEADITYALGFFSGADLRAPFTRGLQKIQLYTTEDAIETLKEKLNLKEVDNGGNIELYVPYDAGVFYGLNYYPRGDGKVPIVSDVQLYMDLFNDPARGEEAAEHLREVKLGF